MTDISTNKLSVYLIKEEYPEHKDILKKFDTLQSKNVNGVGVLYFGETHTFKPSWLEKFFGSALGDDTEKLFNASSKAILLTKVKVAVNKERVFAILFDYGWTFLNHGVWEERFGLKITLNTVDPNNLRRIDFQIIFGIISSSSKELEIPFFSKVSLRNAKRRLETYGCKVSLQKISAEEKEKTKKN